MALKIIVFSIQKHQRNWKKHLYGKLHYLELLSEKTKLQNVSLIPLHSPLKFNTGKQLTLVVQQSVGAHKERLHGERDFEVFKIYTLWFSIS